MTQAQAVTTRTFGFRLVNQKDNAVWTINKRRFDPSTALATPKLGTVERWRISSDFHHPVHLHLDHFQVLSRNGHRPGKFDAGWKDTVDLRPYELLEVLVKCTGFTGRNMLHRHNLEHEDMAMMVSVDVV